MVVPPESISLCEIAELDSVNRAGFHASGLLSFAERSGLQYELSPCDMPFGTRARVNSPKRISAVASEDGVSRETYGLEVFASSEFFQETIGIHTSLRASIISFSRD